MATRRILNERTDNETLRRKCRTVDVVDERIRTLLDDLAQTMYEANGVGLAAPQVGILRRVVVIDVGDEIVELINPEIMETSGEQDGMEGCLSVPGEYWMVKRPNHVKARAQDRHGDWFEIEGEELIARCICHECDHLDGHLYTEIAYRKLSDEEIERMHTIGESEE